MALPALLSLFLALPGWAQNLPFGAVTTGTISSAAQTNRYTFSANANDVVDFTLAATSGSLSPKIQLYTAAGKLLSTAYPSYPNGTCDGGSTVELNTFQLPASATYTVLIGDCSDTNAGNYTIYAQLTDNPSGAANLPFGGTETGTIGSVTQSNSYTFSATANEIADLTITATSGSLSPKIRLYNPNGTLLQSAFPSYPNGSCDGGSTIEMNPVTLTVSGTYTVLVGDCSDTSTGTYEFYAQRTQNPAAPLNLPFGQIAAGMVSAAAQSITYTFSATANDVVDFTLATTSGSLSPKIRLYDPTGAQIQDAYPSYPNGSCDGGSTVEMNTVTLKVSGTFTALVGDCGDTNTGGFVIYAQPTNNPSGAANLPFGQVKNGLVGSAAQSNTYTFSANANDLVNFTLVATSGALSPKIRLYSPAGAQVQYAYPSYPNGSCDGGSTVEMNTVKLPVSGTYIALVGDCSDTNTGNYVIYLQRTNNPYPPTGLLWGQLQSGVIGSVAQSNSYTVPGTANDVVSFTMVATKGSLSPKIRLYNPDGTLLNSIYPSYPNGSCDGGSTVQMNSVTLGQTGTYTVLVGDCSDVNTGNYNLSSLCFGVCPLPAPVAGSLSPASAAAGGGGFTLTVNGSNFVSGSVVIWNGADLSTTYVSATQLTATVPSSDIATAGMFPVKVLNPSALAGPSNAVSFTALAKQTITFPPPSNQPLDTLPFTPNATASSGLTVGFASNTMAVCTVSGSTVTLVVAGTCSITASQAGNSTYAAATPVTQTFTVLALQTITFPNPGTRTLGAAPFTLSATANSGLTVTFASNSTTVCTVSGVTVTLLTDGTCSITASQAGNSTWAPASVTQKFTVLGKPQAITFAPLSNVTIGVAPFGISATANSGLTVSFASNTLSVCTVNVATVTILTAGSCSITASQPGNLTYAPATPVTETFTVLKTQAITFAPLSNVALGVTPFGVSATASSGLAVTFKSNTLPVCTLNVATVTILTTGTCSITASQAGNSVFAAATPVTRTFAVLKAQTITFPNPGAKTLAASPYALSATSTSLLAVAFVSNSAPVCTVSGTEVTLVKAGTCSITASQAGNSIYAAATPVTQTFAVSLVPQTITFAPLPNRLLNGAAPPPLSATASSGLTVTLASNSASVCTVSGVTLTLIARGTCSITASQPGNTTYAPATAVTRTLTVFAGPPAIVSLSPNAGAGASVTFRAVYTDPNGAADLSTLLLQVNTVQSSGNACYVYYQPQGNHLYLATNAGAWMMPALTPGVAGTASNSQCTLNAGSSSVTMAGDDLTLNVALSFNSAFVSARGVYLYAAGLSGENSGWVREGTWTPNPIAEPPTVVSLSPNAGTGTSATFRAVFSDPNGAGDLSELLLQINTGQSAANACYVYYQPRGNHLYLANSAGAWMTPALTPGVAGTVSSGQCTLNAGTSSVATVGNDLTLSVALTFSDTFMGPRNVYLYAAGLSGLNSGWVRKGSWTP